MAPNKNNPYRSNVCNRISESVTVSRRRAVQAGLITALSLSGCLDDETEDDPEADQEDDTDAENGPVSAVRAFSQAAADEDIARMDELSHSQNPLNPAEWVEEGWEFHGGGDEEELDEVDMEVTNNDATVEDLFELEAAEFWFDEEVLAEALEGEQLAAVEITAADPTADDSLWMMATEDGEWRYLFVAAIDDTPDDPEEAFEEPIEDEDNDVVVDIDWEDESTTNDFLQAAVELTDERGIEANRIRIESTIAGGSTEVYDDDEFNATWDGGIAYVLYDADGDQIVVTAINEEANESEVVHREQYEP